jgi:hypothetical protein
MNNEIIFPENFPLQRDVVLQSKETINLNDTFIFYNEMFVCLGFLKIVVIVE